MENIDLSMAQVADMQELCNLLIMNGYRLVKMPSEAAPDPFLDSLMQLQLKDQRRREELTRLEVEVNNPQLVKALKSWRNAKAKEDKIPSYFILSNRTLLNIALNTPATMDELLAVNGIGPQKADAYGAEILDVVARVMEVVPEE